MVRTLMNAALLTLVAALGAAPAASTSSQLDAIRDTRHTDRLDAHAMLL